MQSISGEVQLGSTVLMTTVAGTLPKAPPDTFRPRPTASAYTNILTFFVICHARLAEGYSIPQDTG